MLRATTEPKHKVFIILPSSTAAQTSALSPTLAGENGRCLETDYLGERAYDGHHLPMVGLFESNCKKEVEMPGFTKIRYRKRPCNSLEWVDRRHVDNPSTSQERGRNVRIL